MGIRLFFLQGGVFGCCRLTDSGPMKSGGVGAVSETGRRGTAIDYSSQRLKRPCSLSGDKLDGDNMSRYVYVDESGISSNDRVTVVAGIIVNADKQLKGIEERIEGIIAQYVPEEYQEWFSFHATDLFHGSGRIFDRRQYPREVAHEILKKLIRVT